MCVNPVVSVYTTVSDEEWTSVAERSARSLSLSLMHVHALALAFPTPPLKRTAMCTSPHHHPMMNTLRKRVYTLPERL